MFLAVKLSGKVLSCNLWRWTFVKVREIGVNLHIFLLCLPAFCTVRQDWHTGAFCTAKFCLVTSQDIYFTGLFNIRYFYIVIYHVIFATMGVINQSSWIEIRPGAIKPLRNVIMNIKFLSQYLSKQRRQIDQKKLAMIYEFAASAYWLYNIGTVT